jgi:hypothetical protein
VGDGRLRVITGEVAAVVETRDPQRFQAECVEAFVASWTARGFAESTIANDVGVLERMLAALGRPVWEVTAEDVDRVVGELASSGRAVSTRRNYLQVFKGFHRSLEVRKAAEIEVAFGVRLACPLDEFNAARHVGDDSPAVEAPPTPERWPRSSSSSRAGSPPPVSTRRLRGITRCFARCITPGCGRRRW